MGRLEQTIEDLVDQHGCQASSWGSHGAQEIVEGRRLMPQNGSAGWLSQLQSVQFRAMNRLWRVIGWPGVIRA